MKKTVLLLSLVFILLSGLIASAAVQKPKKLTAVIDIITRDPDGLSEWLTEYKKITGIELEATYPPHNEFPQKLKVMFASGDVPDIIEVPPGDYTTYALQGALYPIDKFIAKSTLMKSVNKEYLEACRMPDGKIYGFPLNPGSGCVGYIRKDWIEKLGLKVPTTWDELYAFFQAATTKDPDGNGKNDTYGYTTSFDVAISEFDYYNRLIMLDARFDFMKKGKVWVDGFTEKEMIAAIERYKKMYKEGLIDQEFFTNKTSTARSKFTDGKVGLFEYWSGAWAARMEDGVKASIPTGSIMPINPIKGAKYGARMGPIFGIYAKSKNAEAAFKYWDELQVDKSAGQMLFVYGSKGVNYDVVDGKTKWLPKRSNPKELMDKMYVEPGFSTNDWKAPIDLEPRMQKSRDIHKANSELIGYVIGGENFFKYAGEIWKVKQQIFSKIVIGDITIEEGMKQYKEKVKGLNIDKIIKELNTRKK